MDLQVYEIERASIFFVSRRKLHIYDYDSGKCLCGCQAPGSCTNQDANKDWITQPDPDKVICIKCKKIAAKLLKINPELPKEN